MYQCICCCHNTHGSSHRKRVWSQTICISKFDKLQTNAYRTLSQSFRPHISGLHIFFRMRIAYKEAEKFVSADLVISGIRHNRREMSSIFRDWNMHSADFRNEHFQSFFLCPKHSAHQRSNWTRFSQPRGILMRCEFKMQYARENANNLFELKNWKCQRSQWYTFNKNECVCAVCMCTLYIGMNHLCTKERSARKIPRRGHHFAISQKVIFVFILFNLHLTRFPSSKCNAFNSKDYSELREMCVPNDALQRMKAKAMQQKDICTTKLNPFLTWIRNVCVAFMTNSIHQTFIGPWAHEACAHAFCLCD